MKLSLFKSTSLGKIFLGNFVVQATTILQTVVLARVLGPEGKGVFTEAILWPNIIAGFSILGLYTGIVKCTAKDVIFERYDFAKTTLKLTMLLGFIGMIISITYTNYLYKDNALLLRLCLLFSPFILANNVARGFVAIDHGRRDFKSYSITRSILNPIFLVFILILLVVNRISVASVVGACLLANIVVAGIRVYLGLKKRDTSKKEFSSTWLLKYSLKFAPSDFSEPIYSYYDKAIVALILSSYDLGIYTVAFSAAAMISILPNVYSTKIFSDVASGDSIDKAIKSVRQNVLLMAVAGLALAVLMPFLVPIVVGSQYNDAILPAIVLLIVCCLKGQSVILERTILAKGYPYVGITAKVITMILFALFAVILKIFSWESIMSLVIVNIITQTVYLAFLAYKMRSLFNVEVNMIPNHDDIMQVVNNIKTVIK